MVFTYLRIKDLIERSEKEGIKDLPALAHELSLRHPQVYDYRKILLRISTEDKERGRRFENSLFTHILDVLQIDPFSISDKFVKQPIII